MPDLKSQALSGFRWSAGSAAVVIGMGALQAIVVARVLEPRAFGLMAIVSIVTGFAGQFAHMGISEAIIQRKEVSRGQLSSLYWINVFSGLAAFVVVFVLTPWIARLFRMPELRMLLPVAALSLVIGPLAAQFQAVARKELRFDFVAFVDMTRMAGSVLAAIVSAVFLQQGVWSLVWGLLANTTLQAALYLGHGIRWGRLPSLRFSWVEISGLVTFGLYRLGAMLANYLNSQIDQLVIGVLLGPQQLGYYNLVSSVTSRPIAVLSPAVTGVAFPIFARIQDDAVMLKKGLFKMLKVLASANAPLLIGFSAMAPVAIPFLFGEKWLPAVPLAQILSFCALLRSFANAGGSLLWAKGYASWSFYFNLSLLVICPPIIFAAAQGGSIVDVAWALLLLQVILSFYLYFAIYRRILGPFLKELASSLAAPVLLSAIMAGLAGLTIGALSRFPLPARFFAGIAVAVFVYVTAIMLFQRNLAREILTMIWPGRTRTPLS